MQTTNRTYHLPVRPYSPIDAVNRAASAKGSPRYAQNTADADYNGHAVRVYFNDYRGYWVADYTWAGRNVLARGPFTSVLDAALREYNRGALGASLAVEVPETHADALASAEAACEAGTLVRGAESADAPWWMWQHAVAAQSVKDYCFPTQLTIIFDWTIMQQSTDRADYEARLKAHYGRVYA